MTIHEEKARRLDDATARRLTRLAAMPIDTTRLRRKLLKKLHAQHSGGSRAVLPRWFRPALTMAATVVLSALIGLMVIGYTTQASAAPIDLSKVHRDVVSARIQAQQAIDLVDAKVQLAAATDQPTDRPVLSKKVRCCCGRELAGDKLACVRLNFHGKPVTLLLVRGSHVCAGDVRTVERGDRVYAVHGEDSLQITMAGRGDLHLCVMGELSTQRLVDIAEGVGF